MTSQIPSEGTRRRQIIAVVVASVLVLSLGGVALWSVFRPRDVTPRQAAIEPAVETTAAPVPTSSPAATASPEATTSVPGGGTASSGGSAAAPRPQVAYRSGGAIYRANPDGTAKRRVAASNQGPFALSPDGRTLALVTGGKLTVYDVASGRSRRVGDAAAVRPVWTPDASTVYYVRGIGSDADVRRVRANGTKDKRVHDGSLVTVSPDGTLVAVAYGETDELPGPTKLAMKRGSEGFTSMAAPGAIKSLAATNEWLLAGVSANGTSSIMAFSAASPQGATLVPAPEDTVPTEWTDLAVSPDQAYLAAASTGDDGYSRVVLVPLGGGEITSIISRYDQYVSGWLSDASRVVLLEGNYVQGEAVRLVSYGTDGIAHTTIARDVTP